MFAEIARRKIVEFGPDRLRTQQVETTVGVVEKTNREKTDRRRRLCVTNEGKKLQKKTLVGAEEEMGKRSSVGGADTSAVCVRVIIDGKRIWVFSRILKELPCNIVQELPDSCKICFQMIVVPGSSSDYKFIH
ncbi:hypothetical protein GEV33_003953 [Tenebrio molitor]|uniref:Uncharacterized protein n=1 Tax=Tenebrio molitor TaxID=7067 RepID=A0A8J6HQP3_TENMO|nr:hypothetical protein GEV33_003953 [Tenebrio molitor]